MKRIISLILTLCIISGFSTAFAEKDLQSEEKRGIINTDLLTEENVLYKAMQNKKGFSFFDLNSNDDITANFDIVLGFDMSSDMYDYDYNGDMAWAEQFKALEEQVPDGTRFAVVTNESSEFTDDLDSSVDNAISGGYSGSSDIVDLLDNCLNTFDGGSQNNVVIATAAKVSDPAALSDKMDEMLDYGVIPFVFVLDSEKDSGLDGMDYVYQCASDLELRLAISDLYLSFAEFSNAGISTYGVDDGSDYIYTYLSDYKPALHKYSIEFNQESKEETFGRYITEILNIYGCLPAIVEGEYDLTEELNNLQCLFNGRTVDFKSATSINSINSINSMISFWGKLIECEKYIQHGIIQKKESSGKVSINNITMSRIEQNIKMRFPVILVMNGKANIITSYVYKDGTATLGVNALTNMDFTLEGSDFVSSMDSTETIYVFDTYEYLNNLANSYSISNEKLENEGYLEKVHIKYPKTSAGGRYYSFKNDNNVWTDWETKDAEIVDSDGYNRADIAVNDQENLLALFVVTMEDGISDIYNANLMYKINKYTDINSSNVWYYDYVTEATNKSIINGYNDTDENGNIVSAHFNPDGSCTRAEFVKMALAAAGFEIELADGNNSGDHWAENYMSKAREMSLLIDNTRADSDFYNENLERGEAAYILTRLFIYNVDSILIPTLIYHYNYNISDYKTKAWNDKTAFAELKDGNSKYITDSSLNDALYQMYMNGVMQGSENYLTN